MSYIGKAPIDRTLGLSQKNATTGDGSTTSFDMLTTAAPEGGATAVDVFVDNVRQEPGSGKAYVIAQDGSGDYKRITFSTAPASGAVIWSNNRLRTQIVNVLPGAGTVGKTLLNDDVITGQSALGTQPDAADTFLLYDDSASAFKKVTYSNLESDTADMAANSVKVRDAATTGAPSNKAVTDTQILIGDGTGFTAAALSGDVTMANTGAVTIAVDAVDLAMLSATGTASADTFLRGDNTWSETVGGASWVIKTGTYTTVSGDGVMVDTSASALTMTLPASPTLGDFVRIMDYTGNAATNNITVGRASEKIQGTAADLTIATNRASIGLVYSDTNQGWLLIEN